MKFKKFLPLIITAAISLIMLIVAFLSSKVNIGTFPYVLYEKLGMYFVDENTNAVMGNVFSINGTLESFVTFIKSFANKEQQFSVNLPAFIYSAFAFASLCMLSKSAMVTKYKWTGYLAVVLLPVIFLDFSNIAYFKTFYNQPLILTLLLLIFAVFVITYQKGNVGITATVVLFVLTVLYGSIGVVQAITAIVFGALIIRLSKLSKSTTAKIISIVLGAVTIVQSLVFTLNYKPFDYKQQIYNSVFFGVCKYDSVTELGLDPKLDDFKEVYFGMKENEKEYDLESNFYSKISYSKLMKYYLTHPVKAVKIISNQASLAFYNDKDFGFTPYSTAKKLFFPVNLVTTLVFVIVSIILSVVVRKKHSEYKYFAEFYIGLTVALLLSLFASALYHGNCDVNFNMYTFNIIFDITFITALVTGIRLILSGQDEKKEKYGITHE